MGPKTHYTAFGIGEKVHVDGDESMTFVIVSAHIYPRGAEYRLAWVSNGNLNESNIDEFRLSLA